MTSTTAVEQVPLSPALGVELRGLDLSAGVGPDEMAGVMNALNERCVVLIRNQNITPEQQVAFSKMFGRPLRVSLFSKFQPEGVPELTIVSNIKRDGQPIGVMDAGALWHTDGSYLQAPDMYSVLYSREVPHRDGQAIGNTAFTSTAAAYEALPAETKSRIAGLRAVNSLAHHITVRQKSNLAKPPVTGNVDNIAPDVEHPVVRSHPVTGKKCLFVSEGHTKCIVGMDPQESESLLKSLFSHLVRPEFMFSHTWRVGDLLVWDNCSTQHLAVNDYGEIPRLLHRVGIAGPSTA